MKERRWGRIINVLNIGAKAPRPNSMPTSVSRAAGMAMTKALSAEFAPHNVLVNAMLVGFIEADQHVQAAKKANIPIADYYKAREKEIPLGRAGKAGGVRQSRLLPGLRPGRLHHRHRDQRRWRPLAGGVTFVHTRRAAASERAAGNNVETSGRDVGPMPRLNRSGQRAGAGRPAEPAGQFARRHGALDRRRDRADHHEGRDDAGADDLRPRHRDAAANLDRLAVPVEPAVAGRSTAG